MCSLQYFVDTANLLVFFVDKRRYGVSWFDNEFMRFVIQKEFCPRKKICDIRRPILSSGDIGTVGGRSVESNYRYDIDCDFFMIARFTHFQFQWQGLPRHQNPFFTRWRRLVKMNVKG